MQIGDKLLCKQDYRFSSKEFYSGQEYIIENILSKEEVYFCIDGLWFYSSYNNMSNAMVNIWDYFYSPSELRKLKLKNLQ